MSLSTCCSLPRAGDGAGRTVRSGLSLDKWGGAKVGSSFAMVLGCVLIDSLHSCSAVASLLKHKIVQG